MTVKSFVVVQKHFFCSLSTVTHCDEILQFIIFFRAKICLGKDIFLCMKKVHYFTRTDFNWYV